MIFNEFYLIADKHVIFFRRQHQEYKDFPITDTRSGGKFDGSLIEASVGFLLHAINVLFDHTLSQLRATI